MSGSRTKTLKTAENIGKYDKNFKNTENFKNG